MRARIRTIKPEFFGDERINTIPVGARYIAIGLMSMADDRGRIKCMLPAVRTYVFPSGDISEKQFKKALDEVLAIGFAWRYEVDGWSYLWLPKFWRHQVINRPSESDLPPHPRDPHGGLPVHEAMADFKECARNGHDALTSDSVNEQGGLTPSRAGARSVPVPSSSNTSGARGANHARKANQDEFPDGLDDAQRSVAGLLLPALLIVWGERGGAMPTMRGVGLAVAAFPDRDHLAVMHELEHWALAGNGAAKPVKDVVRLFRTFLERSPAAAPMRNVVALNGRRETASDWLRDINGGAA